jgi:hypothetical protein
VPICWLSAASGQLLYLFPDLVDLLLDAIVAVSGLRAASVDE